MKTVTELLREYALEVAGVFGPARPMPGLDSMRETEWCPEFERFMRNRLLMGPFRYGLMREPGKPRWDRVGDIVRRAEAYRETGNLELLVDIANAAMLEYVEGDHPNRHWRSEDDGMHAEEKQQ